LLKPPLRFDTWLGYDEQVNSRRFLLDCLRDRDVVFFVGSGVSLQPPACLPGAPALTRLAADLFLPEDPSVADAVQQVVSSIQPEVFYEQIAMFAPDAPARLLEVLGTRRPVTLGHFLIVLLSARAGRPIITTNFDLLLERAAEGLGLQKAVARPFDELLLKEGELSIWKVHGSIDNLARLGAAAVATTMARITQPNLVLLAQIAKLAREKHLCLIGYSGRDIDLFPYLCQLPDKKAPIWIDPAFDADDSLRRRAQELGAWTVCSTLDEIVRDGAHELLEELAHHGVAVDSLGTSWEPDRKRAEVDMLLSGTRERLALLFNLTPVEKKLLFVLCLNKIGRHEQANEYLDTWRREIGQDLDPAVSARVTLTQSRLCDCISDYDRALLLAQSGLSETRQLLRQERSFRVIALRVQALHAYAMAKKMQLGPSIAYACPSVDVRPDRKASLRVLGLYLINAARMRWTLGLAALVPPRRLGRARAPQSTENAWLLQAWTWYFDHLMVLFALLDTARKQLPERLGVPSAQLLGSAFQALRKQALRTGDSFALANAEKQLDRLGLLPPEQLAATLNVYRLITDPLNEALVLRDEAERLLDQRDHMQAKLVFEACLRRSEECGSYATMLKAIAGLVACGVPVPQEDLAKCDQKITGWGFRRYLDRLQSLDVQRVYPAGTATPPTEPGSTPS
jgi:hypothetical protein